MLDIENLTVELISETERFYILRDFSLSLKKGEILGLAGESGSGKSVLAKSILGLNKPPVIKTSGGIILKGNELKTEKDFAKIRGREISMIFQDPKNSLNPVMTIGEQLTETIRLRNKKISKKEAAAQAVHLMKDVDIDMPQSRFYTYPHQLSGGMNQRIMTAAALACNPEILIADEPTTALDVTIQEQIIKLIQKLNKRDNLAILFVSHDLSLLSAVCDRIAVLYCGELMEIISGSGLIKGKEKHPYSRALKECIPAIGSKKELTAIKGTIGKNNFNYNEKCIFADRCNDSTDICFKEKPVFKNNCACHNPVI